MGKFFNWIGKLIFGRNNWNNIQTHGNSLLNSVTGAHMTNAQVEATNMEQSFAREQMAFQKEMSDTAFQRQVQDMKNAGVNPALALNSGSSTPSGASASAQAVGSPDPVGLIGQLANISLLESQRKNIDADTEKKLQDIKESQERIENLRANTKTLAKKLVEMDANIRNSNLDADAKEITNSFLRAEKEVELEIKNMSKTQIEKQNAEIDAKIRKLDEEKKAVLQSIEESKKRMVVLGSQAGLNSAMKSEYEELAKKVQKETAYIEKETELTQKDINWYTHDKIASDVKVAGSVIGNVIGIGKLAGAAKSILGKKQSSPVDLRGYGAYGSYDE